jgi:isopropylmalate/homocitrate/citramalate synthase
MAHDFFEIVGTEVPMRLADNIGTKTPEQIRKIVAEIKARVGSKVARP